MFNKEAFKELLIKAIGEDIYLSDFAKLSGVNRTYLSKYTNLKLNRPPAPDVLKRIADAQLRVTYEELMHACGYIESYKSTDGINEKLIDEYWELIQMLDVKEIEAVKEIKGRGHSLTEVNNALKDALKNLVEKKT